MNKIMSIKEAAKVSGLSEYTIRQGIRQGKLPACQLNGGRGKYLIDYETFQLAIKNLCTQNISHDKGYGDSECEKGNIVDFGAKIRRIHE